VSLLYSLLGFVIMLGVLVFVHEWGHYIVGRLFNVKVLRFSIGFGPVVWRRQWGETEWALSAVPLGGYVKFLDEREGPVAADASPRAFNRQPPWKRMLIVFAGPFVNLVFAWLVFSLVYWVGFASIRPVVKQADDAAARYWIVRQVAQHGANFGHRQHALDLSALVFAPDDLAAADHAQYLISLEER